MFRGISRRSRWVALVGLPLVVITVVAIALPHGTEARPSGAIVAICAVVFSFVAVLLYAQRLDLREARAADAELAALAGPAAIVDPTMVGRHQLAASLALRPAGAGEGAARDAAWDIAESSWRSGAIVCAMIPFAVVPWVAFGLIWPLLIGGLAIGIYALFLSARLVVPGGGLDQAFSASERALAPLGLEAIERPSAGLSPRLAQPGFDPGLRGAHVVQGNRHGRTVTVTHQDGSAETVVATATPEFQIKAKGERLKTADAPAAVTELIAPLRASSLWHGVTLDAGPQGITVTRKRDPGDGWLCDLWLAESVADRAGPQR